MTRFLGTILLLAGSAAFGIYQGCLYCSRLGVLYEVKKAFLHIQGEIRYMNTPMPEALESTSRLVKGACQRFFQRVATELEAGKGTELKSIWEEAVRREMTGENMEREAMEELLEIGGQLGCLDRKAQEKAIDYFLKKWDVLIEKRQKEKNIKLKLYYTCGIMSGLMIVIILL